VEGAQEARVVLDGRQVLLFCSNNYLGLANHPEVREAAMEAADRNGCGSGASRLISGNMRLHEDLEARIASFKRCPACTLFNNGYAANVGVISALMGRGDLIFSDALNHASIIDGCRLSRAEVKVYRHRDPDHLEWLLQSSPRTGNRLIVTDGLFSMDGDLAPLPALRELARRHGCLLMVDEAHAIGVLGENGRGVAEWFGLEDAVDITLGTLGKALGSFGAFVTGSVLLKEYLLNHARSFIFSTSLPPPVIAAALKALEIAQRDRERRESLNRNAALFAAGLRSLNLPASEPETPIQCVLVGEDREAMALCERLLDQGVYAQGIRPPTVPPGTARVRFSMMATHTPEEIDQALKALASALTS
jgi:8-amino-7-oxononanoate synthase